LGLFRHVTAAVTRLLARRVTEMGQSVRYQATNKANSAVHPPGVGTANEQ